MATLDADIFKQIQPVEFYRRFLERGSRPDGRAVDQSRQVRVHTGAISNAHGSSLVKLGGTTVICGIKAEIAHPLATLPHQGYFVPNVDMPALCSPNCKPGAPSELTQSISHELGRLFES